MIKLIKPGLTCLLLLALSYVSLAQNRIITGTVVDSSGNPLAGATVNIKNSKTVSLTDLKGKFSIQAPPEAKTLVVNYVGMVPGEVTLGSNISFTVTLQSLGSQLSDVVVIGYGTAKKANLTTAQTTISSKDIEKTVNTTVEQAIQGRSAGVYVTQNSGQPGGGMSVNIRGVSTITGNTEPLYVIDGVQMQGGQANFGAQSSSNALAGLNPSDIEDIQILQGPSATAIYGSRGTNGVVLITTKRGKSGDARIDYGFQYNIQTPPKHFDVMDLSQYAQLVGEYHNIAGGTTPGEFLDPSLLGEGTDWQDELFNSAPMMKNQLSLSGGTEKTTYYLSGEYLDQDGVASGSGFKRYSFRTNIDSRPRTWLTLGVNLAVNQTDEKLTTSQENLISNALQMTPQVPVKNIDGSWAGADENNGANQFVPVNPIALSNLITNTWKRRQFLGGINVGISIAKGLTFRTSFNANVGSNASTYYIPTYDIGDFSSGKNDIATLTSGTSNSGYWNWNQLLEYTRQFGKHNVSVMASHEAQESTWKNVSGTRTGFLTNDIFDLEAGDPLTSTNSGGSGEWAMESYLGRVSYNFDNRYILVGTFRADGSVNFGANNKWGYFPSVSAAWRISQESFFDVSFISDLKLRLEAGTTGNQGGGAGIYSPLGTSPSPWGTAFLPQKYANKDVQWEPTTTYNAGINVGLLKNRITVEFDYYNRYTDKLLLDNPLPWYMGTNGTGSVQPPIVNIGALTNNGWSLTINTTNISNKNFTWSTNLNLSSFKTKIDKFYSDAASIDRVSWWLNDWTQRSVVGEAPWLFRGYVAEGLFQSVDEINNSAVPVDNNGNRVPTDPTQGIWVGDVKYKDINGDGVITANDLTFIGNPWPKLFGGFTNTFSYKGFDLSILLIGTFGNDIYNQLARVNSNPNNVNLSRNLLVDAINYARPVEGADGKVSLENPGTNVARIATSNIANDWNYNVHSSKWVEDGSYIRIKNISLSYTLPAAFLSRQNVVKGIKATVGVQNIFTITNYSGFDPEVGAYVGRDTSPSNQAIGLDYGRYPITPVYTFNLGVNF